MRDQATARRRESSLVAAPLGWDVGAAARAGANDAAKAPNEERKTSTCSVGTPATSFTRTEVDASFSMKKRRSSSRSLVDPEGLAADARVRSPPPIYRPDLYPLKIHVSSQAAVDSFEADQRSRANSPRKELPESTEAEGTDAATSGGGESAAAGTADDLESSFHKQLGEAAPAEGESLSSRKEHGHALDDALDQGPQSVLGLAIGGQAGEYTIPDEPKDWLQDGEQGAPAPAASEASSSVKRRRRGSIPRRPRESEELPAE